MFFIEFLWRVCKSLVWNHCLFLYVTQFIEAACITLAVHALRASFYLCCSLFTFRREIFLRAQPLSTHRCHLCRRAVRSTHRSRPRCDFVPRVEVSPRRLHRGRQRQKYNSPIMTCVPRSHARWFALLHACGCALDDVMERRAIEDKRG